jgi:hypothetical protein
MLPPTADQRVPFGQVSSRTGRQRVRVTQSTDLKVGGSSPSERASQVGGHFRACPDQARAIPCPVQAVTGSMQWSSTPRGRWPGSRWVTCADRLGWSSCSLGSMIALCQRAAWWRADNRERSVRAIAGGAELHCDQHRRHRWPAAACGTDVWHLRGSGRQGPLPSCRGPALLRKPGVTP